MPSITTAQLIESTVADAIRERLIAYTPTTTPHQHLILAYTDRLHSAYVQFCSDNALEDAADVRTRLEEEIEKSQTRFGPLPNFTGL